MKLEVNGGCFCYPHSTRRVLQDVSFSLASGDILAVLGPNGAGKTTLLRCMTGLLRWQSGETLLDGTPISAIAQRALWRQISYVPQAKQATAAYSVEEMVLLGRTASVGTFSLPDEEDLAAVERSMEKLHIESLRHRSCAELSGGELQMVLIARALASNPKLLVLDEPESGLDFRNQLLVLDTIAKLSAEGIICVFNTHDPAHALRIGNRALMLSKEGSYCFGDVRGVVTEEHILQYFGVRATITEIKKDGQTYAQVVPLNIGENR